MNGCLLDVNVALAIVHPRHAHTDRAMRWLAERAQPGELGMCRVVQMGLLRLRTSPSVMKEDLVTFDRGFEATRGWTPKSSFEDHPPAFSNRLSRSRDRRSVAVNVLFGSAS